MKRLIICLICTVIISACHRKAVPEGNTNGTSSSKKGANANDKSATAPVNTTPSFDNKNQNTDTRPPVSLDLGKSVFVNKCGKCHELKQTNNYTKNQWENILKAMAPKAKLSTEETDQVSAYIMANAK